ncbi:DNA repair protein complementing XP-C cells homolog isoform X1 [Vanessa atalanta]|uniref:DNA repair protein complementing XP-C cells homolog isoform X1 n=1 Tax=Vanessa atalanta TaxID=42275 RepID=UPI001FCE2D34|nr:DNA repair protein complementing XP-C cells homolog isoform X1 [Vanessa atalanta]
MPTTRKKVIKTVYKDEDSENEGGDFSDSGSEAVITDQSSSDEEEEDCRHSSEDDFQTKKPKTKYRSTSLKKSNTVKKTNFTKSIIHKINKQQELDSEENVDVSSALFSVKDLTDTDKLLPVLNLSESDSSDDESPTVSKRNNVPSFTSAKTSESDDDADAKIEYKDVWSNNIQNDSAEIAKKTFQELEQHKLKIEETKLSVQKYTTKNDKIHESDVKDLLALGEEEVPKEIITKKKKKKTRQDSDSEIEDWEEVKEANNIPQQGLQLIVDIPNDICRRTKKLDVEMMMKRKINRVKKEYQVYMHKVHVLCWLGHGNYVSQVLNDPTVLAAALSVVPSKDSYPGDRVDMKYLEQITTWFNDKMTLNQDKSENKFKPKLPPLKSILLQQIKSKVFTTKKYMVFVFVSMLRSLGLQCRVMFNFVTLPIKPPTSELCSLSTKEKESKNEKNKEAKIKEEHKDSDKPKNTLKHKKEKIPQLDGNYDSSSEVDNIMQADGGDDNKVSVKTRRQKTLATKKCSNTNIDEENVSPPKRTRRNLSTQGEKGNDTTTSIKKQTENNLKTLPDKICTTSKAIESKNVKPAETTRKSLSLNRLESQKTAEPKKEEQKSISISSRRTRSNKIVSNQIQSATNKQQLINEPNEPALKNKSKKGPKIVITNENNDNVSSEYFGVVTKKETALLGRKRSRTSEPKTSKDNNNQQTIKKTRTRSAHTTTENKSKYFNSDSKNQVLISAGSVMRSRTIKQTDSGSEDDKRVSHKDIEKKKAKPKNDVTNELIDIIKGRVQETKIEGKKGIVKTKIKQESDEDSDYLAVESPKSRAGSDDDFKPTKTISKPKMNVKKIDRRVISTDDELPLNKIDVWCEIYVEELEEWVPVDVIKGKVHCVNELYNRSTHPVKYIVGWDNNNYLKDLTRRYVPHWNTITRKQRVDAAWWDESIKPWVGPKTARDKEEDERLNRMLLEAPLPKSISEYKNHPLYALKRHLLKFEAIYPPDAAVLGFVRSEPVYARDCVYVCKSREIWLKDAKVVKLGEEPYKTVKARPKWDKLSNKMITGKALEIFGPWQVQDYEPPTAENGIVPRNPYGNVELFKECMLPKGTVLIKLHGLNRVAKKLNIDCAPAMTGFDYNGGYCHPVFDGFVVCKEFEDIITEAWLKDQEEQERKEEEKIDARVYGNWRKLIRGLLIKERLKAKYGFEEPSTSKDKIKAKGPRLVVKKK